MNKEELRSQYAAYKLSSYFEKTERFVKNSILMELESVEDQLPLGMSRIGGLPDLPKNQNWFTTDEGVPMLFVAQINFEEVKAFDVDNKLPSKGILYLFYDQEEPWGFDPKDKNGKKVFFYEGPLSDLETKPKPATLDEVYDVAQLSFSAHASLPDWGCNLLDLELTEDEYDRLTEFKDECPSMNKLLGHSDNIQDGMELECELVTNGLYCGDSKAYKSSKVEILKKNVGTWNLLLQIDSNDEACNMMWGDSGRIYLWIKDEDLRNKNFENTWLVLQCY